MVAAKLGYYPLATATSATTIKSGAAGLYGMVVTTTGVTDVTVYDGLTATSAVLFKGVPVLGTPIHFGGVGYAAKTGLTAIATGTGTVNILYT